MQLSNIVDAPKNKQRWRCVKCAAWSGLLLLQGVSLARAGGLVPESAGVRFGTPANLSGAEFNQAEAAADWDLPWRWDLGKDWHVQTRLNASLGWLGDSRVNGAICTLGPSAVLSWRDFPVSIETGASPTLLSVDNFGTKNFGTPFQFTSYIGVNFDFLSHFRFNYRFQHMSNAGLASSNPGLNLHMLGLSYRF